MFFFSYEYRDFCSYFLIGIKFLNSYHNTVLKAQRTMHPLKKAFDGFKSYCSGFLCFEDLTDYLVKLKPKHNTSLSLLIFSLALRSGEERQTHWKKMVLMHRTKTCEALIKYGWGPVRKNMKHIMWRVLGSNRKSSILKTDWLLMNTLFPHFDSYLDSPCMPQVTYLMLRIFTTSKEVFGMSCIHANDILSVHYWWTELDDIITEFNNEMPSTENWVFSLVILHYWHTIFLFLYCAVALTQFALLKELYK